jgi:hypothetical protein
MVEYYRLPPVACPADFATIAERHGLLLQKLPLLALDHPLPNF